MTILDRYIARTLLTPTLLTLAVLLVLNSTYLFIDEQSNVGQGTYTMASAIRYVALNVPGQLFDLLPAAVLIGAMVGLGELARHSEIVAMRAAGLRIERLALTLVGIGAVVALLTALVGEFFAPQATQIAQTERAASRTRHEGLMQGATAWVHEGNLYLRVERSTASAARLQLKSFEVSEDNTALTQTGSSEDVRVEPDAWSLRDYRELHYGPAGISATDEPVRTLHLQTAGALLDAAIAPSDRSVRDLYRLVRQGARDRADARRLVFALWVRVAHAVSVIWCVLLALPFALGNLRAAKVGVRLFVAVGVGMVFVLGQQVVESGVVLTPLSPVLLAWLPTALLAAVTLILVVRSR